MRKSAIAAAILLAFAPAAAPAQTPLERARELRAEGDIKSIATALTAYELRSRFLPTTEQGLTALVEKPVSEPVPGRWVKLLRELPKDPWGREYRYALKPEKDGRSGRRFDLWSAGADGKDETGDDVGNW